MKAKEIKQNPLLASSIRNLIYYVHQNFLILIEFVLSRTASSVENVIYLLSFYYFSCGSQLYKALCYIRKFHKKGIYSLF